MEDFSEKVIAFILHLSHSSVNRIINEEQQNCRYDHSHLPSVLCFDEIRVGHQFAFVYASPNEFREILPDRNLKTIKNYFYGFTLQQRKAVTHIVMDMNASYGTIVRGLFPNAHIIIDYIVQLMTRSIHTIRIGIQKLLNKHSREYTIMKHCWRLFTKKYNNLEVKKTILH